MNDNMFEPIAHKLTMEYLIAHKILAEKEPSEILSEYVKIYNQFTAEYKSHKPEYFFK